MTSDSLVAALATGWTQNSGEGTNRSIEYLRAFPGLANWHLTPGEAEAVVDGLGGIEMNHNVLLRIDIVEGGLLVGVQTAHCPYHVRFPIQTIFFIPGIP